MEPHPDLSGGLGDRVEDRVVTARDDVVVVGDGRRPAQRELGQADRCRGGDVLDRDPRPDRIELLQPAEEVAAGRPAAGEPLVEVVVRVDESRRHDAAVAGDDLVAGARHDRADLGDPPAFDGHLARPTGASKYLSSRPRQVVACAPTSCQEWGERRQHEPVADFANRPVRSQRKQGGSDVDQSSHSVGVTPASTTGSASPSQRYRVEPKGIEHITGEERWGKPSGLFWMWAGAVWNVEYVVYGTLVVVVFGLSFAQAVPVIIIGNLFYLLTGFASLQGPVAGTTAFAISRAPFGPNGNRVPSFFNWVTQVGFETEGIAFIVLAGIALAAKANLTAGDGLKIALIIGAVLVQACLPFIGHAAMLKVLRWLALPFVALFVIMAIITADKVQPERDPARSRLGLDHGGARPGHLRRRPRLDRERQRLLAVPAGELQEERRSSGRSPSAPASPRSCSRSSVRPSRPPSPGPRPPSGSSRSTGSSRSSRAGSSCPTSSSPSCSCSPSTAWTSTPRASPCRASAFT